MSNMIYGSFERLAPGDSLVAELNAGARIGTFAIAHGHHLREEEIQLSGTLSLAYAVIGALVVGIAGALFVWALVMPTLGLPLSLAALVPLFVALAPLGVVAGAVSGSAECRPRLAGLAERTEIHDRTLVTAEIPRHSIAATFAAFTIAGAAEVAVA